MNKIAPVSLTALLLAGCVSSWTPERPLGLFAFLDPNTGVTYRLPLRCSLCPSGEAVASAGVSVAAAAPADQSMLKVGEPVVGTLPGAATVAAAAPARYLPPPPQAQAAALPAAAPAAAPAAPALPEPRLKIDTEFASAKRLVVFGLGRAALGPVGKAAVAELVPWARQAEKVHLRGGTDSSGNARRNEELALARAAAVKSAFVAAGVDQSKLVASFCASCYLADNDSVDGRRLNRRVEVEMVLKQELAARMPKPVHALELPDATPLIPATAFQSVPN